MSTEHEKSDAPHQENVAYKSTNGSKNTNTAHPVQVENLAIGESRIQRIQQLGDELDTLGRTALEKAIEAGELLAEAKKELGHGEWLPWLKAHFRFSDRTAQRWIRIAASHTAGTLKSDSVSYLCEAYEATATPTSITVGTSSTAPHVSRNSGENEWYTPAAIIEAATRVMGGIDLDPASSEIANRTVKAKRFFDKKRDGLKRDWSGSVWLNPPYAQPLVDQFVDKFIQELKTGNITAATLLVNNATETKWFQRLASEATAICFPASRIRFTKADGQTGAPLQGQAILYVGDDVNGFIAEFRKVGFVTRIEEGGRNE